MTMQDDFLSRACVAARAAEHLFPEYAACEAALESAWGTSRLALEANNLFGQKQSHPPTGESLNLPTKEYLYGAWVWVPAAWIQFSDWSGCFVARMDLLKRLAMAYPAYAEALAAKDGESFVRLVSKRWSTDPDRGMKVLRIHEVHQQLFAEKGMQV